MARPPAGRARDRVFADTNVFLRFLMRRRGIERVYSYGEDFDRLGVKREEP